MTIETTTKATPKKIKNDGAPKDAACMTMDIPAIAITIPTIALKPEGPRPGLTFFMWYYNPLMSLMKRTKPNPSPTGAKKCFGLFTNGGEGGIRTHGQIAPTHALQACLLGHSSTSPQLTTAYYILLVKKFLINQCGVFRLNYYLKQ